MRQSDDTSTPYGVQPAWHEIVAGGVRHKPYLSDVELASVQQDSQRAEQQAAYRRQVEAQQQFHAQQVPHQSGASYPSGGQLFVAQLQPSEERVASQRRGDRRRNKRSTEAPRDENAQLRQQEEPQPVNWLERLGLRQEEPQRLDGRSHGANRSEYSYTIDQIKALRTGREPMPSGVAEHLLINRHCYQNAPGERSR